MGNKLLDILKKYNIKASELAKELNVNPGQIYQWNKNGILSSNKHAQILKQKFPELVLKEPKLTKTGKEDKRAYNSGRHKKTQLNLKETDIPSYIEPEYKHHNDLYIPTLLDEYGLPYVNVRDRDEKWYQERKNKKLMDWDEYAKHQINYDRLPNPNKDK